MDSSSASPLRASGSRTAGRTPQLFRFAADCRDQAGAAALSANGSHCGEVIAAKALSFLMGLLHLGRVAARKAASAALGRVIVPAGGLHHLPEVVHHLPAVGLGEAALG